MTLYAPVRAWDLTRSVGEALNPPIDSRPVSVAASPIQSPVVRQVAHTYGCALVCRGGVCDCGAVE